MLPENADDVPPQKYELELLIAPAIIALAVVAGVLLMMIHPTVYPVVKIAFDGIAILMQISLGTRKRNDD